MQSITVRVDGLSAHVAARAGVKKSEIDKVMESKKWYLEREAQKAIWEYVRKLAKELSDA